MEICRLHIENRHSTQKARHAARCACATTPPKAMKYILSLLLMIAISLGASAQQTNAAVSVGTYPEAVQGVKSPTLAIEAYKFKSRKGLIDRVLNDFDRTETSGYRLNLTMTITNVDKDVHSLSAAGIALVDESGIEYSVANESEDVRRDALVGNIACKPGMPRRVVISYLVPDKDRKYKVIFKHYD